MPETVKKSQASKMYGEDGKGPRLEREEKSGKMAVKRKEMEKDTSEKEGEDKDGSGQELPVMVRHSMERHEAHHAREREHHMHDMGGHGDKKEMHERHEKMMKDMHSRHEKEHTPEMGKEKE